MFGLTGRRFLILLIVAGLLFAGSIYVPVYFAAFEFNDYIRQQVKYASTSRKTIEVLRADILNKATELGIPITRKDIHVSRQGPSFTLDVEYRWPIDMKIYHHVLVFHASHSGEAFENDSD